MKEDDPDPLPHFSLFAHYLILFLFFSMKSNVFPNCTDSMEVTIVPGLKKVQYL